MYMSCSHFVTGIEFPVHPMKKWEILLSRHDLLQVPPDPHCKSRSICVLSAHQNGHHIVVENYFISIRPLQIKYIYIYLYSFRFDYYIRGCEKDERDIYDAN